MGASNWNDSQYDDLVKSRKASGQSTFAHTDAIQKGKVAAGSHTSLDPSKLKNGIRECRDSEAHPESNAIYIGLDVTGSMGSVPVLMQSKLKDLMGYLLRKGYITDPSICISGIGDAERYDTAPFQVGQFEAGIEVDNDITNLYIEGGGGGNGQESYDLALYFLARCVQTDGWDKRQKKGYAFIICDEGLPSRCLSSSVSSVFGTTVEDIKIGDLVKEVLERWELFCIVPNMTSNYRTGLQNSWKNVLGERVLFLDDPSTVVECIAGCIGMIEENIDHDDLSKDLSDKGLTASQVGAVTTALSKVKGSSLAKLKGTGLATL